MERKFHAWFLGRAWAVNRQRLPNSYTYGHFRKTSLPELPGGTDGARATKI